MANVAKVLKAEISRISRKEVKTFTDVIGKSQTEIKRIVADLKKRLASLEKEKKRLVATMKKQQVEAAPKPPEETGKARLTSKGIRSLRNRLRLSQADFGKLLGTTAHSVYLWEKKEGALRLREKTKAALLSVRKLGARDAKKKLEEILPKVGRRKGIAPKKKAR